MFGVFINVVSAISLAATAACLVCYQDIKLEIRELCPFLSAASTTACLHQHLVVCNWEIYAFQQVPRIEGLWLPTGISTVFSVVK